MRRSRVRITLPACLLNLCLGCAWCQASTQGNVQSNACKASTVLASHASSALQATQGTRAKEARNPIPIAKGFLGTRGACFARIAPHSANSFPTAVGNWVPWHALQATLGTRANSALCLRAKRCLQRVALHSAKFTLAIPNSFQLENG